MSAKEAVPEGSCLSNNATERDVQAINGKSSSNVTLSLRKTVQDEVETLLICSLDLMSDT